MYAIIKTGGKQYRVNVGDTLKVELLGQDAGSQVTFSEVLAVSGEEGLKVGRACSNPLYRHSLSL